MIELKSPREINLMREAGRMVSRVLQELEPMMVPGVTTNPLIKRQRRRSML